MLYGISPFSDRTGEELGLKPVMTLTSELMAINQVPAGEAIGYGGRFVATRDMTIGVAAIGYGDGYPRSQADGTPVLVNGRTCSLAGRVFHGHDHDRPGGLFRMPRSAIRSFSGAVACRSKVSRARPIPIAYELVCRITRRVRYRA